MTLDLGPILIQYDLILINFICKITSVKDPISKQGHLLRSWLDMDLGAHYSTHSTCPEGKIHTNCTKSNNFIGKF